ncbi:hypothetical protein Glove_300g4 [Diversispora epigaea]|uniref:MD-2-related lipid-recognition domain-containing protein n=1 Tax=Diversispora epigaea TaxID=1348612 RepID=A0A397I036_9GLOM|nr:hypothetical protein Glove_300g4 [Diversispora epigaea]
MNRNFILAFIVFILLTSLVSALPHQLDKRETKWEVCSFNGTTFAPVDVKISSDPLVRGFTGVPAYVFSTSIPNCPIFAGTNFNINFPQLEVPLDLTDSFYATVIIGNEYEFLGCAFAHFGDPESEDSYPIASYPISFYTIA